jgi:hypothetical protein
MTRILLEDTSDFVVDKSSLTEAVSSGVKFPVTIKGRLSVCEELNGNGRIYPKKVWERQLQANSKLQQLLAKNRSLGLLEHPKDGNVSLLSPISTITKRVWMQEAKQANGSSLWEVWGEVAILGTPEGRKLFALIEGGYNPLVSSRGYGSLNKRQDGTDEVCEDFECEAWDSVYTPSFARAELDGGPAREALNTTKATPAPWESMSPEDRFKSVNQAVNEGKITTVAGCELSVTLKDGVVSVSSVPLAESAKQAEKPVSVTPSPKQSSDTNMDKLNQIRESITTLKQIKASSLEPAQLAEHLNKMAELHRATAAAVAEDAKASWDGNRIHEELNLLEQAFVAAAKAPAVNLQKIQEREQKTLQTMKAVVDLGTKFRTKFAESTKALTGAKSDRCQLAESKMSKLQSQYDLATDGLDLMTERYHADTSELARRLMVVEMKIEDKAILDRLNEAKTVKQLTAIREELEGKKPEVKTEVKADDKKAETTEAKKEDKKDSKCDDKKEDKKEEKKEEKKVTESIAPKTAPQTVVTATTVRPFSITESVGMSRRLYGAKK